MRNEHEGYAIEAALEAGFVFTNDDGTLFGCTDEALIKFSDVARSELIAEIERLREALRDIACSCEDHCDDSPYGHGAITPNCCRNFARAALGEKE